jgi:histidinol-phosphatase
MSNEALRFIELVTQTAREAAELGAAVAFRYFNQAAAIHSETKDDLSPVTIADRAAEKAILDYLEERFPKHCILAEESGYRPGDRSFRWIIDPIDGTRGFIRGSKYWGTLVGFELDGEVVAGAVCLAALGVTYWAGRGLGAHRGKDRIHLAQTSEVRHATLSLGEMQNIFRPPYQNVFLSLLQEVASTRCFGDPGGLRMVLEGWADVWIEAGVKPWDIAPAKILIEEAGGRFTNFKGGSSLEPGQAIASNPHLHTLILAKLSVAHEL